MFKSLIKNVRQGLATNSSSSHSLVYTNGEHDTTIAPGEAYENEFGWDHFVLDSLGAKLMYKLTDLVGQHYWNSDPNEDEVKRAYEEFGHLFPEFDEGHFKAALRGYVDHQSSGEISIGEARDPHTEIHGGNDNGGGFCGACEPEWYSDY